MERDNSDSSSEQTRQRHSVGRRLLSTLRHVTIKPFRRSREYDVENNDVEGDQAGIPMTVINPRHEHRHEKQQLTFDKEMEISIIRNYLERKFDCSICLNTLHDPIQPINCRHVCCSYCLYRALSTNSVCPSCKVTVTQVTRPNVLFCKLLDEYFELNPEVKLSAEILNLRVRETVQFKTKFERSRGPMRILQLVEPIRTIRDLRQNQQSAASPSQFSGISNTVQDEVSSRQRYPWAIVSSNNLPFAFVPEDYPTQSADPAQSTNSVFPTQDTSTSDSQHPIEVDENYFDGFDFIDESARNRDSIATMTNNSTMDPEFHEDDSDSADGIPMLERSSNVPSSLQQMLNNPYNVSYVPLVPINGTSENQLYIPLPNVFHNALNIQPMLNINPDDLSRENSNQQNP